MSGRADVLIVVVSLGFRFEEERVGAGEFERPNLKVVILYFEGFVSDGREGFFSHLNVTTDLPIIINLNVPEKLRKFTHETFVSSAEKILASNGLSTHDYITTDTYLGDIQFNQGSISARSSATNYALTNCI